MSLHAASADGVCTLEVSGAVALLTLRRPQSRNALSLSLLASLREQLAAVHALCATGMARGEGPRVLLLAGEGKAFCAGMDLKAVLGDEHAPLRLLTALAEATIALRTLPCVTLAVVRGAAIGGGCGLAAVCDLCVSHAGSVMGYPEVDLGVCPAVVAPWLVQKVGMGRARRILLLGGTMSGTQAKELGMVDELVETPEELDARAQQIAARLALGGPHALAATKALLNSLEGSAGDAGSAAGVQLAAAMRRDVSHEHATRLQQAVREGARLSAAIVNTPATQAMLRARLK